MCIAADATHGAIVEVIRRIQAEAIEEAARVCDEAADDEVRAALQAKPAWLAAHHEVRATALVEARDTIRSLSPLPPKEDRQGDAP